jgi:hypothetical protein|tara:strand:+ start:102 stop:785 length:684 start_codon:yes stop_codon:yes gene_type:complete
MVAKKRQKIKQKQKQKQTQRVNVNVKIDQSKRTSSVRPKTTVQRSGPQIVMTTAGSYFPQRLEPNNQYNQLASIMEKIVENERYKASKGSLDSLREKRLDKFEANTAKNALASVSSQYSDTEEEDLFVPEEEDETEFVVPQETDSIIEDDSIMEDTRTPIVIDDDTEYEVIPQDAKVYPYPTRLPIDYFERYFNTETGRWNLDRNVSRQKNGYIQKELSERHYKKNI